MKSTPETLKDFCRFVRGEKSLASISISHLYDSNRRSYLSWLLQVCRGQIPDDYYKGVEEYGTVNGELRWCINRYSDHVSCVYDGLMADFEELKKNLLASIR